MADNDDQLTQLDQEVAERIRQERKLKEVERMLQERDTAGDDADAAADEAAGPPVDAVETAPPPEPEEEPDYKYVRVESLDELKDRVQRVCTYIDEKENDVYNKRRFPYRLAAIMGSMTFFLALVLSFFAEQPPQVVVKRSIGSFFLFAFLGWLVGLVVNYFSPPLSPRTGDGEEDGLGLSFDTTADAPGEIDDYMKGHERVADPVEEARAKARAETEARLAAKQAEIDARRAASEEEREKEKAEAAGKEMSRQEAIEHMAKEAPEQVANAIRTVLTRSGENK